MQNTIDYSKIPSCDEISLLAGIDARTEEQSVSTDAKALYRSKNPERLKLLKQNALSCRTKQTQSCYNYYISLILAEKHRFLACSLIIALLISGIGLGIWNLNRIYNRFYNLDATEDTLDAAIDYYQKGDYDPAIYRLKNLIDHGWDGYVVYQELSAAYYAKEDYNSYVNVLCSYIEQHYGEVNCTYSTDAFWSLYDDSAGISDDTTTEAGAFTAKCKQYADTYLKIEKELYSEQNDKALHDCETLKNAGAECFTFAKLYTYSLIATENYDDAFDYVMDYVLADTSYQNKSITLEQRELLLRYINNYMDSDKQDAISELYGSEKLSNLNLHSGKQYEDTGSVSSNDANTALQSFLTDEMQILNPIDEITVSDQIILLYGEECYPAEAVHYDGDTTRTYYFFYDIDYGYIYQFIDGQYVNLLENSEIEEIPLIDAKVPTSDTINGIYSNSTSDVTLQITEFSESDDYPYTFSLTLTDTASGDILINETNVGFYGSYACISNDDISLTLVWGSKMLILVNSDYHQKYKNVSGVYSVSD
jgi:hypothetical protein